jgi:hypothetical protein
MATNSESRMPDESLLSLLCGLIDYAGLFPPAGVSMREAVTNYAEYNREQGWSLLGRFIVPASRLKEFEQSFHAIGAKCWYLSIIFGQDFESDLTETAEFIERTRAANRLRVDAVELKAGSADEIRTLKMRLDERLGENTVGVYFELSPRTDTIPLLQAIREYGARAKLRTGGVTPDAFPDADDVARFIANCAELKVPFKATAGLHHPLRCVKALTYEADSPTGTMHGFLNVFVAAVVVYTLGHQDTFHEHSAQTLRAILLNEDPGMFSFEDSLLTIKSQTDSQDEFGIRIPTKSIERARSQFCISFGSCSFREPIEDLRTLGLL